MNNNTYIHTYFKNILTDKVCIDMTCGNGNDTYFLADNAKKVYAIDINKVAVNNTKLRCKQFNNIVYINDNHINIDKYLNEKIDFIIYNLGYLPYVDNPTITNYSTTIESLNKVINKLNNNAYLVITFYFGQDGGFKEFYETTKYLKGTDLKLIDRYTQYPMYVRPYTYIFKKII